MAGEVPAIVRGTTRPTTQDVANVVSPTAVALPRETKVADLAKQYGVSEGVLRSLNPRLRDRDVTNVSGVVNMPPGARPIEPAASRSDFSPADRSQVRDIQRRLGTRADGAFGADTLLRLQQFQRNNGIEGNGEVNEATLRALRAPSGPSATRARTDGPGGPTTGRNSYGEEYRAPPASVDSALPHVRGDDRMKAVTGPRGEQAVRNIATARRAIEGDLPVYRARLLERAAQVEGTDKEAAARYRQAAADIGRVTIGTLGVESAWGTGPLNMGRDGPAQATGVAQREVARRFEAMGINSDIGAVDRKTIAGAARVALAHHFYRTMEFDGSLHRAVSQFNGGNRQGHAYTRTSQQNGYIAAVWDLGRRTETIGR